MPKYFRLVLAACAAVVTASVAPGVQAASLTLNDPNCSDFTLTPPAQQGGNWVLSCSAIPQAPTCTLTPSSASPVINTMLTLTANCTQNPTAYTWTGCTSTTSTCQVSSQTLGAASYGVTATNAVGTSPAATTAVTWVSSAPAVVAPSGCTITPSTSSLPTGGGTVNLTAACTGGSAPTDFAWSGGGLTQSGASNQASASITATTTFSVTASNSAGSATASTTVSVSTGTGGGGAISCAAQGYASTRTINLGWSSTLGNVTGTSAGAGGFGPNTAVVATFTTPSVASSRTGWISFYEFGDPPTYRTVVLSTQPCGAGQVLATGEGTTAMVYFTVGGALSGIPTLATGTTYYFTIVNRQNGVETCGATCNGKVELSKPRGL